jgi:DNA-binding MarR family transcriptional regulator
MNDSAADTTLPETDDCVVAAGHPIPRGCAERLALLLARVGGVITAVGEERLSELGIDARDYSILAILADDDPASQLELAQLLGKAPGGIVAAIDRLEENGLVQRTRDRVDRRRSRVSLTHAGTKFLRRADTLADETAAEVLPGLSAAELAQLHELLVRGLRPGIT